MVYQRFGGLSAVYWSKSVGNASLNIVTIAPLSSLWGCFLIKNNGISNGLFMSVCTILSFIYASFISIYYFENLFISFHFYVIFSASISNSKIYLMQIQMKCRYCKELMYFVCVFCIYKQKIHIHMQLCAGMNGKTWRSFTLCRKVVM